MIKRSTTHKLVFISVITILFVALFLTSRKMFYFRNKTNSFLNNASWERVVRCTFGKNEKPIVLFGDSHITFWPVALTFGSSYVLERGVYGESTDSALVRFEREIPKEMPSWVIIILGTNDIWFDQPINRAAENIRKISEAAASDSINTIICGVFPVSPERDSVLPINKIKELNSKLRSVCTNSTNNRVFYVDTYTALCDSTGHIKKEFSRDGVHINLNAYMHLTHQINDSLVQWKYSPYQKDNSQ
jgi:lysophospholipase L1-like esterase